MAPYDEWSHCRVKMSAEANQDDASNERPRNPSKSLLIGKLEGSRDEDHREQDQHYWFTDSAILVQRMDQHEKEHQRQQQEQRMTVLSRSFHRFLVQERTDIIPDFDARFSAFSCRSPKSHPVRTPLQSAPFPN